MTSFIKPFAEKQSSADTDSPKLLSIFTSLNTLPFKSLLVWIALLFIISACKKDDVIKPNPEPQAKVTANARGCCTTICF
ncbi:hypothetical protein Q0590_26695 [Rhodocytophaga aerolata]|uniref:Uncharacterized protein n=1 Tax=Rhodocytophaga aerolata TaxID=455078 RepID=A0ABT8RCR7_9BACT|nr:hypothetical protein [Rhodocytophaga aerolata]MDO1449897.1 hypothetical protein [Rhodocytophaga aerolata]